MTADRLIAIHDVIGSSGGDSITGSASANDLRGGNGDDDLWGLAGADRLQSDAGSDWLYGEGGDDVLTGGAGADRFVFDTPLGSGSIDRVTDFTRGSDRIAPDYDVFTAFGRAGELDAGQFHVGRAAHDADDRLIFDAPTATLFYDPDGTGAQAQIRFAVLDKVKALVVSDFLIVA